MVISVLNQFVMCRLNCLYKAPFQSIEIAPWTKNPESVMSDV